MLLEFLHYVDGIAVVAFNRTIVELKRVIGVRNSRLCSRTQLLIEPLWN